MAAITRESSVYFFSIGIDSYIRMHSIAFRSQSITKNQFRADRVRNFQIYVSTGIFLHLVEVVRENETEFAWNEIEMQFYRAMSTDHRIYRRSSRNRNHRETKMADLAVRIRSSGTGNLKFSAVVDAVEQPLSRRFSPKRSSARTNITRLP